MVDLIDNTGNRGLIPCRCPYEASKEDAGNENAGYKILGLLQSNAM
jgi:hypothetical protein